jgi:hypothetical protein
MVTEETVTISKQEYERLLDDSEILKCCRAAGVDNWQGLDMAMEMYWEGKEE